MRARSRLAAALVLGASVVVLAACGGGGGGATTEADPAPQTTPNDPTLVPEGAIALVAEVPIDQAEFDRFLRQAEVAFEAQGRTFPATGTPEYEQLKAEAVDLLVQRVEFALEAEALGVTVTDEEVAARLDELKQQFYEGDEEAYQAELEKIGATEEDVRRDIEAQLINERLFDEVTKDVTVAAEEIRAYYDENQERFTVPENREVAHILVETEAEASRVAAELADGVQFAKLAREESTDEASAENGGKLTARRGELVKPFEDEAFRLETGEVSAPVETEFGWHLIKALGDVVPEAVTSFAEVEESIESQLLQEKQYEVMSGWVQEARTKYEGRIFYAVGFEPLFEAPSTTDLEPDTGTGADSATGTTP